MVPHTLTIRYLLKLALRFPVSSNCSLYSAKSSLYRPVVEASTPHSTSSSSRADSRKPESKVRAGAAALSTKRRATMNSRDAAYDEEEILKRVIEESKEISGSLGKRAREDNDEYGSRFEYADRS